MMFAPRTAPSRPDAAGAGMAQRRRFVWAVFGSMAAYAALAGAMVLILWLVFGW